MEAAKATAAAWANTPEGVEARLLSEPFFIREVWRKKIEWLRANREARHTNDFLMGTVKNHCCVLMLCAQGKVFRLISPANWPRTGSGAGNDWLISQSGRH